MPHDMDLIVTLAAGLVAALALGLVAKRLALSPIVGYLVAGYCIGPFSPGFVADGSIANQFAELGVEAGKLTNKAASPALFHRLQDYSVRVSWKRELRPQLETIFAAIGRVSTAISDNREKDLDVAGVAKVVNARRYL